jgi:hypothetical protein
MIYRVFNAVHRLFLHQLHQILIPSLLIVLMGTTSSCSKNEDFDPSTVTLDQLKGTWRGEITAFKNNTLIEKNGDVALFYNQAGDLLDGIFDLGETHYMEGFLFSQGTLYFKLILSDSTNPQCSNWNLSGHLFLQDEHSMVIRIAGNECGPLGKQYATYEGILIMINPDMDPSTYYSFGKTGATWVYETSLFNGTVCEVQQVIGSEPAASVFQVNETNNCGWPSPTKSFNWQVTPFSFSIMSGTSTSEISYTFWLDAVEDKKYTFYSNNDTTYLTLTKTDVTVTTPAGTYSCGQYQFESRVYSADTVITKGTLFLNKQYGFIKMTYTQPADSTNIEEQVLTAVTIP